MHQFTIKDIENLTGIKAHTLRVWEKRYGIGTDKRKDSLHRLYDNEDLKLMLRVSFLYHHGYKISQIAEMDETEMIDRAIGMQQEGNQASFINQLVESSLDFDQARFEKLLHTVILHAGLERAMMEVIFPFMQKIGLLWLTGHAIPAQEHFSSNLIQKKIILAIDGLEVPVKRSQRKVLLFAPAGEMHEMPLLFMHYLMKKHGIPVLFFGRNVDIDSLHIYNRIHQPTHLFCHVITNLTSLSAQEVAEQLTQHFPQTQTVLSGPAFRDIEMGGKNLRILRSLADMLAFSREL
jgi:MerR family transcriptional regulator, light-induced transcriptional regulator